MQAAAAPSQLQGGGWRGAESWGSGLRLQPGLGPGRSSSSRPEQLGAAGEEGRPEGPEGGGDRKDQGMGGRGGEGCRDPGAREAGGVRNLGPEGRRGWARGSREPKGHRNPPGAAPTKRP